MSTESAHLAEIVAALSRPAAYPHPVDAVTVLQTHISVVFLAGPDASTRRRRRAGSR